MKLLFCRICLDVFKLRVHKRHCACGKSAGYYTSDGVKAVIIGPCVPIGIDNDSFDSALQNRPSGGEGSRFTAFVIPKVAGTVTHIGEKS